MSNPYNVKSRVLGAFRHLLVPLVRILVRNGVGFHEFAQVSKEVYAKVCLRDFSAAQEAGHASRARVAILTGLTRREVDALLSDDGPLRRSAESESDVIVNLLQGWHTDADFVGPYGVPRDLYLTKDPAGLQTFTELARRYGGGESVRALVDQLLKIEAAVVPTSGEPIQVTKRTYIIPEAMAPTAMELAANGLRRLCETVDHNLQSTELGEKLFNRWVFPDDGILERDWERFHAVLSERLQELVRELESRFSWFESPRSRGEEGISVGVGMYVYRDSAEDKKDWEQMLGVSNNRH